MDSTDSELLRADWQAVEADADRIVSAFYSRLFRIDPKARSLFSVDMSEQREKLAATLRFVVDNLESPERLRPALVELGRKHAQYGIQPEDFELARIALIETLQEQLSDRFDEHHRAAWRNAYDTVASVMLQGMEDWRRASPHSS